MVYKKIISPSKGKSIPHPARITKLRPDEVKRHRDQKAKNSPCVTSCPTLLPGTIPGILTPTLPSGAIPRRSGWQSGQQSFPRDHLRGNNRAATNAGRGAAQSGAAQGGRALSLGYCSRQDTWVVIYDPLPNRATWMQIYRSPLDSTAPRWTRNTYLKEPLTHRGTYWKTHHAFILGEAYSLTN